MGFFSSLTGGDQFDAIEGAVDKNRRRLDDFREEAFPYLQQGYESATGSLRNARNVYNPYTRAGRAATNSYSDALGLNGAEGNARAVEQFQTGPGYEFAMGQGEQAAQRAAAASGMLSSGNTLAALTEYGQGVANQEYGGYLDRLQGLSNQGLAAAGGKSSVYGAQAGLDTGYGQDRVALANNIVQGRMALNNQLGQAEADKATQGANFGMNAIGFGAKLLSGGLF